MIEIRRLTKKYGSKTAVNDVTFNIPDNETLGFLGRNGAGKSTTLNIITGYTPSSSGSVLIDGIDIVSYPEAAKRLIGYLPEQPPLYPEMTVEEYLYFAAALKGVKKARRKEQIERAMEDVTATDVRNKLISGLSRGYRQRVGIAQAILNEPKYIILDEPTSGLDPVQIMEVRELIKKLAVNRAVVISSHILSEMSGVCSRLVILHNGVIAAMGAVEELVRPSEGYGELIARSASPTAEGIIRSVQGVADVTLLAPVEPGMYDFLIKCNLDCRQEIIGECFRSGGRLVLLQPRQVSLESVFMRAINEEG